MTRKGHDMSVKRAGTTVNDMGITLPSGDWGGTNSHMPLKRTEKTLPHTSATGSLFGPIRHAEPLLALVPQCKKPCKLDCFWGRNMRSRVCPLRPPMRMFVGCWAQLCWGRVADVVWGVCFNGTTGASILP